MNLPNPQIQKAEYLPPPWNYSNPGIYSTEEEGINILEYWRILYKHKLQILITILICTGLAIGISLLMPKKYVAEVSLMPISNNNGGGMMGMVSQLGSMPLLGGALGDLEKLGGTKNKELVNILKSRTLTEKIIKDFDLLKIIFIKQYDSKTNKFFATHLKPLPVLEDGVRVFKKKYVNIEEDKKSGLIKIEITMKDPVLAAQIANRMVLELQDFIENNSLTVAKRNRIFLEEQLIKTRAKLLESGKELNQFYGDNKISSVVPQLDVNVGSYQTTPKAFEDFMEDFENLSKKQKEAEEAKLQTSVRRVPGQVYLQYLTLNRELLAKTYGLLTQQYELAKIEESKEDFAFQVIDKAQPKVRPFSPKITLNVAIGFFCGGFLGIFLTFFRDYLEKLKLKEKAVI